MSHREWFEDDDLWTAFQDVFFDERRLANAQAEAEQVLALANPPEGGEILDQCCGIGRHSAAWARMGYRVTAIDRTMPYLEVARQSHAGTAVNWTHANARDFCQPNAFDMVTNLFSSFGYFEDPADNRRVLQNAFESLRPGGVFVLDMMGKDNLIRRFQPRSWHGLPPSVILEESEFMADLGRIQTRWTKMTPAGTWSLTSSIELFSGTEMKAALLAAGFASVQLLGSLAGAPYDLEARRLVAVARKAG